MFSSYKPAVPYSELRAALLLAGFPKLELSRPRRVDRGAVARRVRRLADHREVYFLHLDNAGDVFRAHQIMVELGVAPALLTMSMANKFVLIDPRGVIRDD